MRPRDQQSIGAGEGAAKTLVHFVATAHRTAADPSSFWTGFVGYWAGCMCRDLGKKHAVDHLRELALQLEKVRLPSDEEPRP